MVHLHSWALRNGASISSHPRSSFVTALAAYDRYDDRMKTRSAKPVKTRQFLAKRRRATVVPIESRITILGHQKVILDNALAEIYGVSVKRLNQQVNRNQSRFPADFMFQITPREFAALWLQIATAKIFSPSLTAFRIAGLFSCVLYFMRLRYRLPSTCRTMASISSGTCKNAAASSATAFGSRSTR